jgi:hypothetical protein
MPAVCYYAAPSKQNITAAYQLKLIEFHPTTKGAILMNRLKLLAITLLCLTITNVAEAKWWIFGQSENEISTRYLYLNGVSYDELGDKVTVYRETLPEGRLVLRGKAGTTSSQVGVVQVSRDGKGTWQEAARSDDGTFEYGFKPEIGKSYLMYVKIMDTTGKSNDVEATRKEVTVSDQNISALVRKALNDLIAAYRAEDPRGFMNLVSPDFSADAAILDRAIRRDFTVFDNIDLRYTLNNVTSAGSGKVFVSLSFTRGVTSTRSGKTLTDTGSTEFVFSMEEKGPKVFSMKNPLIFGLSDAENVATGTVPSSEPTITVASDGSVTIGTPPASVGGIPAPQNLHATNPPPNHHMVDLEFSTPMDEMASQGFYEVVVEESLGMNGPWQEAVRKDFDTFVRVESDYIAQKSAILYFRAKIVRNAGGESSPYSNVVSFDNR